MAATVPDEEQALEHARAALVEFRRVFGKSLDAGSFAEVHVARALRLHFPSGVNTRGYDAIDPAGKRYQIKYRSTTSVIDVNNFDFDYLVLVNLDADFQVGGMWRASLHQVQQFFTAREGFRKHQIGQAMFKRIAERVR